MWVGVRGSAAFPTPATRGRCGPHSAESTELEVLSPEDLRLPG